MAELMTEMFAVLQQPPYLLDVRRNGVGGQGSWSPREFATIIPTALNGRIPYTYLHLPCLAPSIELLEDSRQGGPSESWEVFRRRYSSELTPEALSVAQAFIETAAATGGLAVFLCAEADRPTFDQLSKEEQDGCYCHRFTLAKCIAQQMKTIYPDLSVKLVQLDLVDFWEARQKSKVYQPRTSSL